MGEKLGAKVVEIRKMKNITQKELCDGICSQGTISLIEKGKILPSIDILIAISLRLNVPITYFFDIIYMENTNLDMEFLEQVEKLLKKREFEKVFILARNELNSKTHSGWYLYYFKWLYYLCSYHIKIITIDEAIKQITKLFQEAPEHELDKNYLLARIQNSLAILYATKKDFKTAMFYYNKINLDTLDNMRIFDFNSFKLKVIFNEVKTVYDMGKYEEAIEHAQIGISESIRTEKMTYIGNFYYYIGQCYEKLGYPDSEISVQYKRAKMFFEILGRDKLLKIINEKKAYWCN